MVFGVFSRNADEFPINKLMNGLNKSTQWEEYFLQEALELEEKMKTLDVESLNKSKLRICLEHGILDWNQYAQWYMVQKACSSLKPSLGHEEVSQLAQYAQKTEADYARFDFWNNDLIPLTTWEGKLIVIGLQYNDKLVSVGSHIFILSPPEILVSIARKVADQKVLSESSNELSIDTGEINDALEGLNFNQAAPKMSFTLIQPPNETSSADNSISFEVPPATSAVSEAVATTQVQPTPAAPLQPAAAVASVSPPPPPVAAPAAETAAVMPSAPSVFSSAAKPDPTDKIWEFISERHQEYSFEVKKQFDAFIVLKVSNEKTQIFKMDPDLSRQNINPMIFEYSLEAEGPFKAVRTNKRADVYSMQQLEIHLNDFQHAYIAPLIRGDRIVGFFVGFKKNALSQQDKVLLAELAVEAAS
jgi:hypothetical protein